MARDFEGQLSFDLSQCSLRSPEMQAVLPTDTSHPTNVLCLQAHRSQREEVERSHHFSEILKLVAHLKP